MSTLAETEPESEKQGTTFDQASREATGARPYGRYLEEFEEGATYKHWPAKTVTEADDHLFCLITMNHHPLHINDEYARQSQQGRNVVVGPLVYSLALGMTVGDISGKAIANLATEELSHPAPVFHGDTLYVRVEGARGSGLRIEARPGGREGQDGRLQPAKRARRDLQARGARTAPSRQRRLARLRRRPTSAAEIGQNQSIDSENKRAASPPYLTGESAYGGLSSSLRS